MYRLTWQSRSLVAAKGATTFVVVPTEQPAKIGLADVMEAIPARRRAIRYERIAGQSNGMTEHGQRHLL